MMPLQLPAILGRDIAGTVEAVGANVTRFHVGERVLGMVNHAYAELVAAKDEELALIPEGMSFETAASLPLVLLTGEQLVTRGAKVKAGQTVLVTGALALVGRGRRLREDRRDVPLGPHAEHEHVERRRIAERGTGQLGGVTGRSGFRVVTVGTVRRAHRVDPVPVDVDVVEQRLAGLGVIALAVPVRQEALVAPPQVDGPPVDVRTAAPGRQRPQRGDADPTAGEHERRGAPLALGPEHRGSQAFGGSGGHSGRVGVDQGERRAHATGAGSASTGWVWPSVTAPPAKAASASA